MNQKPKKKHLLFTNEELEEIEKEEKKEKKEKENKISKKTKKIAGQGLNKMALVGFGLGLASIFLSWIGIIPILGIIFSSIGISQTRKRNEEGKVLAIIGLILSIIYFVVYLYQYGHLF